MLAYQYDTELPSQLPALLENCADRIPFDKLQCNDLEWIAESWAALPVQAGELLPRWDSFNVADFARVLDKLCVLHVRDWRTNDIEFVVYGGHPTRFVGLGKPVKLAKMRSDPVAYNNYVDICDRVGRAVCNSKPQYARKTLSWNGRDDIEYETLILPFAPDGSGVQRVLQPVSARCTGGGTLCVAASGVL